MPNEEASGLPHQHECPNSGQCAVCQGWFDNWPGGICPACQANGY